MIRIARDFYGTRVLYECYTHRAYYTLRTLSFKVLAILIIIVPARFYGLGINLNVILGADTPGEKRKKQPNRLTRAVRDLTFKFRTSARFPRRGYANNTVHIALIPLLY